ncbi:phosphatase PAP2 family protein [Promicromonospora sukumoe]|uniref:phosphatase PAP2 family protein n=1 Tax=Promicromonospora sukumoe TaxID=88382 RepID=UPI0037C8764A
MDVQPLTSEQPARTRTHRLVGMAVAALTVVAGLAVVIVAREHNEPFGFERAWMNTLVEHRSSFWTVVMLFLDGVGGGWITVLLGGAAAGVLVVWRRPWAAVYLASSLVACTALVHLVKLVVARPRPTHILVVTDSASYPSGHSATAAVIAVALGLLFHRTWVWVAGGIYTVAMMFSRTYLGAHWISDTVAGALLGAAVAAIVFAVLATRLDAERARARPALGPAAVQ